jgi:hypothetical protein
MRKSPIHPFSFPNAIILPAQETVPIISPRRIARTCPFAMPLFAMSSGLICGNSIMEIRAAAAPPIPLKNETS